MQLITIEIARFPLVIITDVHCQVNKVRAVRKLYPHSRIICLGDITDLFSTWESFNQHAINYFREQQIPTLGGNHEAYIQASQNEDLRVTSHVFGNPPKFNLQSEHFEFLANLPRGFKLELADGTHYLCYHNTPNELWGHYEQGEWTEQQFNKIYQPTIETVGVLHGHLHKPFVEEYINTRAKRYSVGALKYKNFCVLTEQGVTYKSLDDYVT